MVGQAGPHHHFRGRFGREGDIARTFRLLLQTDVEEHVSVCVLQSG